MITYIFLFLSALGLIDSTFLTYEHFNKNPFACPLFGGCEAVTTSSYSEILGIPVAFFGMLYYLTIFGLTLYSFLKEDKKFLYRFMPLTIFGFLASGYLMYIMFFVLGALCFYCLVSAISSTLLFIIFIVHSVPWKRTSLKENATS